MAINLPTLSLPDLQANRVLDAYKAKYGTTTQAETVKAFKKWLAGEVRAVVIAHEAQKIDEANNANKRNALAAMEADLPDPDAIA